MTGQKLIDFELQEIGLLFQQSEWVNELEGFNRGSCTRREDIRNCFKLIETAKNRNPKTLEREFLEKLSAFQQNLDQNLSDHLGVLRLEEHDVSEVEGLIRLAYDSGVGAQEVTGSRPRKRSMLPGKGRIDVSRFQGRKSMDVSGQSWIDPRQEGSSPNQYDRNYGTSSKSPASRLRQFNPTGGYQMPESMLYRGTAPLNQSNILGQLKADFVVNDTSQNDGNDFSDIGYRGVAIGDRTPKKAAPRLADRELSPGGMLGKKVLPTNDEDENLLRSGLFDDRKTPQNASVYLLSKGKGPQQGGLGSNYMTQPALTTNSVYQVEHPTLPSSSFREPTKTNIPRYLTPHKNMSVSKLNPKADNKTPDPKRVSQNEFEVSRRSSNVNLTSNTSLNNRPETPNNRAKTPTKALPKGPLDTEPIKGLMRNLEGDTLQQFAIKSAQLRDEHVFQICEKLVNNQGLRILDLSSNMITDAGLARVCEVIPTTNITNLCMRFNQITNEGLKTCFRMVKEPGNKVKTIAINPCRIEKGEDGRRQIIDTFAKKGVAIQF